MKCPSTFCILLFAMVLSGCSDGPSESTPFSSRWYAPNDSNTLEYYWPSNRTLKYRFELSQEIQVNSTKETVLSYLRIAQGYEIAPRKAPDGDEITLDLSFREQRVSMREGPSEGNYDSTKPEANQSDLGKLLAGSFGKLAGNQIVLILGPNQSIDRIEGLAPLLTTMTQGLPENLKNMILSIFDEDRIRLLVFLTRLPYGEIKRNQAWPIQETRQFGLLGQTKLDGTAKLLDTEIRQGHSLYQIQISGKARNASPSQQEPAKSFVLSGGTFEGTAWFDSTLGQYADSILTYDLNVNFNVEPKADETDRADLHVIQKYSTKLLSVEETN